MKSLWELQEALDQLTRLAIQTREHTDPDEIRRWAESQLELLQRSNEFLASILVEEGRSPRLIRPASAEIGRVPLNADEHFSCVPTFIIGCRRSGTTLVSLILDGSDDICALPESFAAAGIVQLDNLFRIAHRVMHALEEPLPRIFRRIGLLIDGMYADFAARKGKRRWVSKELPAAKRLDLLDSLFDYRARYLYVVRHGFSVAQSCAERFPMRDGIPLNPDTSLDVEAFLHEWISNNESTFDFYERNRDRCFLVRYEELTRDPHAMTEQLFEFVGEKVPEHVLETLGDRARHRRGMGDNKIQATGGRIHPAERRWETEWPLALRTSLGRKANVMLGRLGYEVVK
jgi:hypothetical protein